jgi:hypothetical protein
VPDRWPRAKLFHESTTITAWDHHDLEEEEEEEEEEDGFL